MLFRAVKIAWIGAKLVVAQEWENFIIHLWNRHEATTGELVRAKSTVVRLKVELARTANMPPFT